MESKPPKTIVQDTLMKLKYRDAAMFCLELDRRIGVPVVALLKLAAEPGDASEMIDHLFSSFTEADAVSVAVDVLNEIDYDTRKLEERLRKSRAELIHGVSNVEPILDELLTKGVIQQDSYDKISALPTSAEKMKELHDGHLKTAGDKEIFSSIIKRLEPHLLIEETLPLDAQCGVIDPEPVHMSHNDPLLSVGATGSDLFPEHDWIKLEPEVNCVDADDAPVYSLQSEAGAFECSVSGLRWVCKEKVSFKYQFCSWEGHADRLKTMWYFPGGPLLDITVISGKLDEAHLPHWICTENNPTVLDNFAVVHIDTCGDIVEQVSEVTSSHVKLSGPIFSPRGVLMRAGFSMRINCKVLKLQDAPLDDSEIVHLLDSSFTEADALPVAVSLLKKIGCNGDTPKLEEHLKKNRPELIHGVSNVEPILDELLTKGVIQQDSYDKISALPTSAEKMKELLDGHLKTAGDKEIFSSIIERLESHHLTEETLPLDAQRGIIDPEPVHVSHNDPLLSVGATGSDLFPEHDWIKLEPEVNCVDADDAPVYSLQSEAGAFECSVSGLRWVCKEKVSFKYQFCSWEGHADRLETMWYIPGGPLLDITVIAGKIDEAHLPHWICTEDSPTGLDKFAVLHIDTCGDIVEQVSEVTSSHVKLSQPAFSPRGVLMRAGFSVKIHCKVLIYKTTKTSLTLHVYVIPCDPALEEKIQNKELSSGCRVIQKPYPEKSLKMRDYFILTADMDTAEIYPKTLKLIYEWCDPNFFEVFIDDPDSNFELGLRHETSGQVWTCAMRKDDYQNTGDLQVMYDIKLARLRPRLVNRVSTELINQLLDDLLADGVLNDGEKDSILQDNSTSANRARHLIDMIRMKGREASRKLLTHLQSRDPMLCAELGLPSGPPV
ncbi:hypothetical protein ABVT39_015098 [Epinephelus coioides]